VHPGAEGVVADRTPVERADAAVIDFALLPFLQAARKLAAVVAGHLDGGGAEF
jgi:hypothetical protein